MEDGIKRVYFQHVMDKVVERVKENNPDWFDMHKEVFFETTDYMFELKYLISRYISEQSLDLEHYCIERAYLHQWNEYPGVVLRSNLIKLS